MAKQSIVVLKSIDSGWIELELNSREQSLSLKLPSSSHSEPLADLLDTLLAIHHRYETDPAFATEPEPFHTFWEGDPWQYTWSIFPKPERILEIELSYCADMFAGIHTKDELQLSSEILLDDLLENLYLELERTLVEMGLSQYREKWKSRDFPITGFFRLRSLVRPASGFPHSFREEVEALSEILALYEG